ncbi:MAG: argininosuccinate synthase [Thermodesulfobacteriota bacterium]|nr:argininosuccinate synthase [Thermodesulfobacteriota bacterium]
MSSKVKKVVLAYSGGLDSSVIVRWLIETYGCEVVTLTGDVGQKQELDGLEEKALATGAVKAYVEDLKEEFVRDFVFPALRANAVYEGTYLLGTSLARPIVARRQIEIAHKEGADAVCHGATGKGNDQVRFEMTYMALDPDIKIISAWKDENWTLNSREAMIDYAEKHNISIKSTKKSPYSEDGNLLHISHEGGILEDLWREPPEDMYVMSVSPENAPDRPAYVEITFEKGTPVAVDGKTMGPAQLLDAMNTLAGANGVGRVDMVENRFVGMKSRGIYETPGGTVLWFAHRAMETITMDREVMLIRDSIMPRYAQIIYNGFWYSPEREMIQKMVDESQKDVTGTVRLKLYKGNCTQVGVKAPVSLYSEDLATFDEDEVYNQKDATGFIRLNALRLKMQALLKK